MKGNLRTLPISTYLRLNRLTILDKYSDKDYLLKWDYRDRYYHLYTVDLSTGKPVGNIRLSFNETMFIAVMDLLEKVLEAKEEVNYSIELKSRDFNGEDKDKMIVKGKITLGKKKHKDDYINYILLTNADGSLKFPFKILPSRYYIFEKNGESISNTTEISDIMLKAYIEEMKHILKEIPKFSDEDLFTVTLNRDNKDKKSSNGNNNYKKDYKKKPVQDAGDDDSLF